MVATIPIMVFASYLAAGPAEPAPAPKSAAASPTVTPAQPRTLQAARTWTDSSGTFTIVAQLVSSRNGLVALKRTDNGQTITLPVERLSEADRRYLQDLAAQPGNSAPAKPAVPQTFDDKVQSALALLGGKGDDYTVSASGANVDEVFALTDLAEKMLGQGHGLWPVFRHVANGGPKTMIVVTANKNPHINGITQILGEPSAVILRKDADDPDSWYEYGWVAFGVVNDRVTCVRARSKNYREDVPPPQEPPKPKASL